MVNDLSSLICAFITNNHNQSKNFDICIVSASSPPMMWCTMLLIISAADLLHLLEAVQKSYTQHLQEMAELETKIDSDHASKLLQMHELLQDEMKQELLKSREALIKDLKEIGNRLCWQNLLLKYLGALSLVNTCT